MSDLYDLPVRTADGAATTLAEYRGKVLLIVNVASKCGFTPQYAGLEALARKYRSAGLVVLGFPCNQFMGQEPGSMDEILEYCATTWGVSFPVHDKVKVNGSKAAPLYKALKQAQDVEGHKGRIQWNFEKFVLDAQGRVVARFNPSVEPEDARLVEAVERALG